MILYQLDSFQLPNGTPTNNWLQQWEVAHINNTVWGIDQWVSTLVHNSKETYSALSWNSLLFQDCVARFQKRETYERSSWVFEYYEKFLQFNIYIFEFQSTVWTGAFNCMSATIIWKVGLGHLSMNKSGVNRLTLFSDGSLIHRARQTRAENFVRFAVISLRSLVIPLIPPLMRKEPPMCHYRSTFFEKIEDRRFIPKKHR